MIDEILLVKYKKQNQDYYVRKINNKFWTYKFLGLVNKDNGIALLRLLILSELFTIE